MARKKRNRSGQRDTSAIASPPAVRTIVSVPLVSDRRLYHPMQEVAPVYSPRRSQRRIVEAPKNVVVQRKRAQSRRAKVSFGQRQVGSKFTFAVPRAVELCVRRAKRRQVLFAMRRTGKGSRKLRRRRNYWSGVTCK